MGLSCQLRNKRATRFWIFIVCVSCTGCMRSRIHQGMRVISMSQTFAIWCKNGNPVQWINVRDSEVLWLSFITFNSEVPYYRIRAENSTFTYLTLIRIASKWTIMRWNHVQSIVTRALWARLIYFWEAEQTVRWQQEKEWRIMVLVDCPAKLFAERQWPELDESCTVWCPCNREIVVVPNEGAFASAAPTTHRLQSSSLIGHHFGEEFFVADDCCKLYSNKTSIHTRRSHCQPFINFYTLHLSIFTAKYSAEFRLFAWVFHMNKALIYSLTMYTRAASIAAQRRYF